jgi:hypothetical protein
MMELKIRFTPKPYLSATRSDVYQDYDITAELVGSDAAVFFDNIEIRAEIDPPPKIGGFFAPIIDDLQPTRKLIFTISFFCSDGNLPDELCIDYLDADGTGFKDTATIKGQPFENEGVYSYEYTIEYNAGPLLHEQYTISNDN